VTKPKSVVFRATEHLTTTHLTMEDDDSLIKCYVAFQILTEEVAPALPTWSRSVWPHRKMVWILFLIHLLWSRCCQMIGALTVVLLDLTQDKERPTRRPPAYSNSHDTTGSSTSRAPTHPSIYNHGTVRMWLWLDQPHLLDSVRANAWNPDFQMSNLRD
jgi:hypothetical protein